MITFPLPRFPAAAAALVDEQHTPICCSTPDSATNETHGTTGALLVIAATNYCINAK
jgi:hypothetical protein